MESVDMDLKINNQIPGNASNAPAGRTEGTAGGLGLGGKQRLQSAGSIGADRVEISSLTEQIADGLSTESAQRSNRVSHLAALFSSGRYSVAPGNVSRALISHSLAKTSESA
jgi:anti-sigma28 factor (negative regulator of flagellin synthesis)